MRLALVCGILLALALTANAWGSLSLLDNVGDIHSVTVDLNTNPTGSFTVNLYLDIGAEEVNGLTFVLASLDSSTVFSLTGRDILPLAMTGGTTLSDPTTNNATLLASPQNMLNPTNTKDIGLTGDTGQKVTDSGNIMSLTISYNSLITPGDYRFNIAGDPVTSDNQFKDHDLPAGQDYILHAVVPAPGAATLVELGLLSCAVAGLLRSFQRARTMHT